MIMMMMMVIDNVAQFLIVVEQHIFDYITIVSCYCSHLWPQQQLSWFTWCHKKCCSREAPFSFLSLYFPITHTPPLFLSSSSPSFLLCSFARLVKATWPSLCHPLFSLSFFKSCKKPPDVSVITDHFPNPFSFVCFYAHLTK